jgi:hypothetical protein
MPPLLSGVSLLVVCGLLPLLACGVAVGDSCETEGRSIGIPPSAGNGGTATTTVPEGGSTSSSGAGGQHAAGPDHAGEAALAGDSAFPAEEAEEDRLTKGVRMTVVPVPLRRAL